MNEYIEVFNILESGVEHTSPHLRWLIRNTILASVPNDAINQICYATEFPKKEDGENIMGGAYAPTRSICINLQAHIEAAIDAVQDKGNVWTSIRCALLHELLDTAFHEAYHMKRSLETGNWNNSNIEEQEAEQFAAEKSWQAAKDFDVEILHFGTYIDNQLEEFMNSLVEDTKETPSTWKELQLYMWKHKLAYYNPERENQFRMRQTFETMAEMQDPWLNEPQQFIVEVIETRPVDMEIPAPPPPPPSGQTATNGFQETFGGFQEDFDNDYSEEVMGIQAVPNNVFQEQPQQPAPERFAPQRQFESGPTGPSFTEADVLRISEQVLRRLFWHVQSKCDFNSEGSYNNPNAVMEPVRINDIPGAAELFSHQDCANEMGQWGYKQPTNGMLKGSTTLDQNLPKYSFYLNVNGTFHQRTFIVQNPNKRTADGQNLSTWATHARQGARIMMLLQKGKGMKAYVRLEANQPLGNETFTVMKSKEQQ